MTTTWCVPVCLIPAHLYHTHVCVCVYYYIFYIITYISWLFYSKWPVWTRVNYQCKKKLFGEFIYFWHEWVSCWFWAMTFYWFWWNWHICWHMTHIVMMLAHNCDVTNKIFMLKILIYNLYICAELQHKQRCLCNQVHIY